MADQQIYGETDVFAFSRKMGQKSVFSYNYHPKFVKTFSKRLIFIWENNTFFFAQVWPEHRVKNGLFWARKFGFRPKFPFLIWAPIFVNGAFVALGICSV